MRKHCDLFTSEMNDGKHCFVFGANEIGVHGAGAALEARKYWSAILHCGEGPQGQSYAIPTKVNLSTVRELADINISVCEFISYATEHPELTFLVTKIGCGYAGFSEDQIKPMFENAPENCVLPVGW
jgi:hypothetical protein